MSDFESNSDTFDERYWQEYIIHESVATEANTLAKEYFDVITLGGIRGVIKRKLYKRKLEEKILGAVTVVTRGDLDAWDEDVRRGVVERPTLNADKYWQARKAKDYASYILMDLVQIVPELPVD